MVTRCDNGAPVARDGSCCELHRRGQGVRFATAQWSGICGICTGRYGPTETIARHPALGWCHLRCWQEDTGAAA
jgi:hypothetical protein